MIIRIWKINKHKEGGREIESIDGQGWKRMSRLDCSVLILLWLIDWFYNQVTSQLNMRDRKWSTCDRKA